MKSCVRTCNDHARTGVLVMQSGNYKRNEGVNEFDLLGLVVWGPKKGDDPSVFSVKLKIRA
jgi:hypothetical protein